MTSKMKKALMFLAFLLALPIIAFAIFMIAATLTTPAGCVAMLPCPG